MLSHITSFDPTYSQNYPALPQVRNNDIPTVTAVCAGNPVRIRDWKAAENEYKKRKTARINGAPVMRAAEVTAAKLRKDSLEHEVIQMQYGGNIGAPIWALNLHSKLDSLSSKLDNLRIMELNRRQPHNYRPKKNSLLVVVLIIRTWYLQIATLLS